MRIDITLKKNRSLPGLLRLAGNDDRVMIQGLCMGLADRAQAEKIGNPSRDPVQKFGNTPTGEYVGRLLGYVPKPARSYGTVEPIALEPVKGQALDAKKNGRAGLWIHSGDLAPGGFLRPTFGCVRITPATHAVLVQAIRASGARTFPVEVKEA